MRHLLQNQSVRDVEKASHLPGPGIRKLPVIISQFVAAQKHTENGKTPWDLCEILYVDEKQRQLEMKTTEDLAPWYNMNGEVDTYNEEWMLVLGM